METKIIKTPKGRRRFFIAIVLLLVLNSALVFRTRESSLSEGFDKKIVGYGNLENPVVRMICTGVSFVSKTGAEWIITYMLSNTMILLFFFTLKNYSDAKIAFFSSIVLVFSPAHLFFNSSTNFIFLLELIVMIAMFLFSLKGKLFTACGLLVLVFASLVNPIFFLLLLILTGFSLWGDKEFRKTKLFLFTAFVVLLFFYYLFSGGLLGQLPNYPLTNILGFLFEFSLVFGIVLINVILAVINFFIGSYKENQKKIILLLIGSFAMVFVSLYYVAFLNIVISALSGATVCFIISRKWEILTTKVTTFFIIALLIVYSSAQFFYLISISPPSKEVLSHLNSMAEENFDFSTLATHPLYEVYAKQSKGKDCETDTFYDLEPNQYLSRDFKEILSFWNFTARFCSEDIQAINDFFYSRSIDNVLKAGEFLNISHILITEEMKSGLMWDKREEGLLFVIRNRDIFERVWENEKVSLIKINYERPSTLS